MSFLDGTELQVPSFSGKDQIPVDNFRNSYYKDSFLYTEQVSEIF